ncbi:MAG: dTDP-4-dehydrorhamnose 3,5-epimerase family protein [Caldilineaceae bacterium]|nr:dTDP-4-dehydrorhamnose 3,5-epimerase family protein [Caldilineaceae bacterium]
MNELKIEESATIGGLHLLTPAVFYDFRGEFVSTFNVNDYNFHDADSNPITFVEDDLAVSRYSVLRGMHGDQHTWKLIQCVAGEVHFVVADMRPTSPSYLAWEAYALTESNRRQVLVPAGCASGMQCLSPRCTISYKQSAIYRDAGQQFTVRWNDPKLNIYWPISNPILSPRDSSAKLLD